MHTKYMGGVNRSDHLIAGNKFEKKSIKYWRKCFLWLIEISVINNYVLCKKYLKESR